MVGREEGIGRPFLYGTTDRFLEHFGFNSLEELPRPEELPVVLRDPSTLEDEEEVAPASPDVPTPEVEETEEPEEREEG